MQRISEIIRCGRDLVAQFFYSQNRIHCVLPGDEKFGLQFFAGAGGEAHAEVGQTFVPGAGHSELLRAVFGGQLNYGMQVFACRRRAVEIFGRWKFVAGFGTALDPHFRKFLILPVREQADAVARWLRWRRNVA